MANPVGSEVCMLFYAQLNAWNNAKYPLFAHELCKIDKISKFKCELQKFSRKYAL